MTTNLSNNHQESETTDKAFLLTMASIFMAVLGIMMFVFSLAYIKDLTTLQQLPDMIWSFACGRPVENGVTLPLLLTLGTVSFIGSGILFLMKRWIR